MHKTTERGRSTGLLEPERARDGSRSNRRAGTVNISEPFLEMTGEDAGDAEAVQAIPRERRRGRRGSKFQPGFSWKRPWVRVAAVAAILLVVGLVAGLAWEMKSVMLHNPRFVLRSTKDIQVTGNRVVPAGEAIAFFAPDMGRSILQTPLAKRQAELEGIPWVRRATVMRLWPDRVAIHLVERTPVAFARDGDAIRLIDDDGMLLNLPAAADQHYSFPVLTGVSSAEPQAERAARVAKYEQFAQALDADGDHVSSTLSEVNLSDPEDIRAVFTGGTHPPVVHFGVGNFLPRYRAYKAHLAEWLRQYPMLRSVDMRYGRQVVLDTGVEPEAAAPGKTNPAHANNAGTKPATAAPKKMRAAKRRTRPHARSRNERTAHRRVVRGHARAHAAERGRRVHHPIQHVVSGE